MDEIFNMIIPEEEQEDIKKLIAAALLVPKEERVILISNANALKTRDDLEKIRNSKSSTF